MIEAVLKPDSLEHLSAVIVLDLDTPWELMNQLKKWIKTLQQALFNLLPQMEPGMYEKMKTKLEEYIKTFEDPQLDSNGLPIRKQQTVRHEGEGSDEEDEDVRVQMPLGEGVLKVNLGIPITVVVTKADLLQHGEKAKFLEENLEFI